MCVVLPNIASEIEMSFIRKFLFLCAVLCAVTCSAYVPGPLEGGEPCLVELLKAMKKLNADFQSNSRAPIPGDPVVCYVMTELTKQLIQSIIFGEINATMPNDAECVEKEFQAQQTLFDVLKVRLIDGSKTLNDTYKHNQLLEARNDLTGNLETVAVNCQIEKEKLNNIFQRDLAIKNETLEAHQTEYCLTKYTVDNALLALADLDINRYNIDKESVNCDGIIDVEKSHLEREVRSMVAGLPKANQTSDCIMDAYKSSAANNFQIALKVLDYLDISKETKEPMQDSNSRGFRNIFATSVGECERAAKSKTQ